MSEKLMLTGVCIKGLKYPINIPIANGSSQTTVATVNVFVTPPLGFIGADTIGSIHHYDTYALLEEDKRYPFPTPSFEDSLRRANSVRHSSNPMQHQSMYEGFEI